MLETGISHVLNTSIYRCCRHTHCGRAAAKAQRSKTTSGVGRRTRYIHRSYASSWQTHALCSVIDRAVRAGAGVCWRCGCLDGSNKQRAAGQVFVRRDGSRTVNSNPSVCLIQQDVWHRWQKYNVTVRNDDCSLRRPNVNKLILSGPRRQIFPFSFYLVIPFDLLFIVSSGIARAGKDRCCTRSSSTRPYGSSETYRRMQNRKHRV